MSPKKKTTTKKKAAKALIVKGLDKDNQRISSQKFEELVQTAAQKSKNLVLETYGQHNVGGRLMPKGGPYHLTLKGPVGQRLGHVHFACTASSGDSGDQ